jgi:4-hydroxybenzoyl-CoA reductase subunit beta
MLRLPKFEYRRPETLDEALKVLRDYGPDAMPVAGGTDVFPKMKRRQFRPRVLVSLKHIQELRGISGDARSGLTIKAGATLTDVSTYPQIQEHYPGLARATGVISTPILRNMGTIGGNLCLDTRCNYYDQTHHWREALGWCKKAPGPEGWPLVPERAPDKEVPCRVAPGSPRCWAVSSADSAPMFIALEARVKLVSRGGERLISVKELYRDDGMFYLNKAPDELVAEICLPPADGVKSTYWKLRRRGAFDFPVLGVAVALKQSEDGAVEQCKIVLGGVGSSPQEITEASQLLIGQKPTPEVLEAVAEAVYKPARPLDNTDYHLFYRKRMAAVYVKRALQELLTQNA